MILDLVDESFARIGALSDDFGNAALEVLLVEWQIRSYSSSQRPLINQYYEKET
jgi:hypothetical protein